MTREQSTKLLRETLDKNLLPHWKIRLTTDLTKPFLGLCIHKDQTIVLNAHHIDTHPDAEILNTIRHEVAHAVLGPGHGHSEVWKNKARELGCDNTLPCATYELSLEAIDAICSEAQLEVTFDEHVETIRTPKYKITRLQEKCPTCGKVAEEKFSFQTVDRDGNQCKMITLTCFHIIKKIIPKATPFENLVTYAHRGNNCKHDWDKNTCNKCGAQKLFPFQVTGARFVEANLAINKGVGIFDDMGLGKTVQALAYLAYHPEAFPILCVVKSGIKYQWFKELVKWLGPNHIAQVISTSRDIILPGLKCYIISYDLLRRFDKEEWNKVQIKTVIIDEVQHIKNPDATRTQEVRKIVNTADHVIPLSGTPWKNRGSEFFTVLNLLDAKRFPSFEQFKRKWVDYYWDGNTAKEAGITDIPKFREYTADLFIRREFDEVMHEMPGVNRTLLYTALEQLEQKNYDEEVSEFVKFYNNEVLGGEENSFEAQTNILAYFARMRHITGLAKIPATVEFAETFIQDTDRKLTIFVHHKDVGQLLYSELLNKKLGVPVYKLTAEMDAIARSELQDKFNNTKQCILIASTLASGEGLNLQSCSDCILHERQWNPQNEDQAAPGRFRRIGQTRLVNVTCVTAEGTIDDIFAGIVERKRAAFHNTMNKSGEMPVWDSKSIVKELAQAIVSQASQRIKNKTQFKDKNKLVTK